MLSYIDLPLYLEKECNKTLPTLLLPWPKSLAALPLYAALKTLPAQHLLYPLPKLKKGNLAHLLAAIPCIFVPNLVILALSLPIQ
jgi:hypothetical protein